MHYHGLLPCFNGVRPQNNAQKIGFAFWILAGGVRRYNPGDVLQSDMNLPPEKVQLKVILLPLRHFVENN